MNELIKDFIVYKRLGLRECLKLPREWRKIAWFYYARYRKKAQKETPPGFNVLIIGILQAVVSKDRSFIDKAIELVDGNVRQDSIMCLTGSALCDIGHYEEGIRSLRKAVELEPTLVNMVALAGALEKAEEYSEKLELSNRILEKAPNNLDGLQFKAYVLAKRGNLDEAEGLARKALRISPKNSYAKEVLGEILFRQERYEEALKMFRGSFDFPDNFGHLWHRIAHCHFELGKFKKAQKAAKRMLKAAKKEGDDMNTPEMKAFLEKLGVDV
ncbi:tetratricopeptide repeat protein [Planctomycetota bacterium]